MAGEIKDVNFQRISRINWLLTGPLLLFFAWPFGWLTELVGTSDVFSIVGGGLFSIAFTLTIIHGHISISVGELHRIEFYRWTRKRRYPWKWFYHPSLFQYSTRLTLLLVSILCLLG